MDSLVHGQSHAKSKEEDEEFDVKFESKVCFFGSPFWLDLTSGATSKNRISKHVNGNNLWDF